MVGVVDIFSSGNFAAGLSSIGTASARPTFELQFNQLQNTIIDQLNSKIEKASSDSGLNNNVDAFLIGTEKKLSKFQNNLIDFNFDNNRNINAVGEMARQLDVMDAALAAGKTSDFNTALERVNGTIAKTTVTNGTTVGIFISDGIESVRRRGLVSVTNGATVTKATKYADFADLTSAQNAVAAGRAEIGKIAQVLLLKAESAEKLRTNTETKLNATILQIQAAQIAAQADKATEIAKIRENYSQLLNAISLSFEVSSGMADRLAAGLFSPNSVPAGSAVNILL